MLVGELSLEALDLRVCRVWLLRLCLLVPDLVARAGPPKLQKERTESPRQRDTTNVQSIVLGL